MQQPFCFRCAKPRDTYWCRGEGNAHLEPVLVGVPEPQGLSPEQPGQGPMRYWVKQKLGQGGMNEIYLALDTQRSEDVVIKIVRRQNWGSEFQEHLRKRVLHEAHILSTLQGRFYPKCGGAGVVETPGYAPLPFVIMEWIRGAPLYALMGQPEHQRGLPLHRFFSLALQIATALIQPHAEKFYHRDLAPDNIMLREWQGWEHIVLLDWGIARIDFTPVTELVKEHKSRYSPPEQLRREAGSKIDQRVDIYSLGIVLWEMLTGHHPQSPSLPLGAKTPQNIVFFHSPQRSKMGYPVRSDAPDALLALLKQMFAISPLARPSTIVEVAERLRSLQESWWQSLFERQSSVIQELQGFVRQSGASLPPHIQALLDPSAAWFPQIEAALPEEHWGREETRKLSQRPSPQEPHPTPAPPGAPAAAAPLPSAQSQMTQPDAPRKSPVFAVVLASLLSGILVAGLFLWVLPSSPKTTTPRAASPRAASPRAASPRIPPRPQPRRPLRSLPPQPAPPKAAAFQRLLLRSKPPKMGVYLRQKKLGQTPYTWTLEQLKRQDLILYAKKRIACRITWSKLEAKARPLLQKKRGLVLTFHVAPSPGFDLGLAGNPSPCILQEAR